MKFSISVAALAATLLFCDALRGQSALDGFDPNANGTIYAVAVQPDGKILIGGDFTTLSPNGGATVTRNHIARLNADGTVDTGFDPDVNNTVLSIAVQPDGKILVGGFFFTSIGGVTRNNIARLEATTGAAEVGFDPSANFPVRSIAVQADGKILIGGEFTTLAPNLGDPVPRNRIARLNSDGTVDGGFDPNATGGIFATGVQAIAVQADGKILAGGDFTSIGGQARNFIALLDATTGLADSFDPNPNFPVFSIVIQADGKILVGGGFSALAPNGTASVTRNNIARLAANGAVEAGFNPNANGFVNAIAVQADGKILLGGGFTALAPNGTASVARVYIARIEAANGAVDAFNPHANDIVWSIAVQADGKILVAGQFLTLSPNDGDPVSRNRIARLFDDTLPPVPSQIVSRKLHGGTPRDINLPISGSPGIECRSGGGTNDYQVVFTFPSSVTFTSASVSAGTGSVSGSSGSGTITITVNLAGVTNAQKITVTLFGASDGTTTGDLSVQVGVLIGDTNGDGSVNSADIGQTKSRSGQAIDSTNFRTDLNVDGSINSADISLVKSRSGTALP